MPIRSSALRPVLVALLAGVAGAWSARLSEPVSSAGEHLVEATRGAAPPYSTEEALAPAPSSRPLHRVLLPRSRLTPLISKTARSLLDRPMGSQTILDIDGSAYAFAVERHYHSPESGIAPTGWHKGVTVYALEP